MLNELYTFAEPVQVVPFSNLKWGKFTLLHTYAERWITEHWAPILERAGIDIVLSAHHHKWRLSEAGQQGKNFPVLTNSNKERMDVVVTANSIEIKTYSTDGTLVHQWNKQK